MQQAELESIMDVIKARDQGQISKRNILKMDSKINKKVRKLLENVDALPIPFPATLPEQIDKCTLSIVVSERKVGHRDGTLEQAGVFTIAS